MDHIIPNMEDLIQQRLADIHIQIQNLKCQQNGKRKKNDLLMFTNSKLSIFANRKRKCFKTSSMYCMI